MEILTIGIKEAICSWYVLFLIAVRAGMKSSPDFEEWTAKAVEYRVIEATETLMLCPKVTGPRAFGSSMPEPQRRHQDGDVAVPLRYRRLPNAGAIDQMEECWTWINALDTAEDRRLLYSWARVKCAHGRSLRLFAVQNCMNSRTLRREISRLCQEIARRLNAAHISRKEASVTCDPDRICIDRSGNADLPPVSKASYETHWRAKNARPTVNTELPDIRHIQR
tara:strand:- start:18978 stop:19646 length:669 start_codon:yes stop_codon:yes gene_type:complete